MTYRQQLGGSASATPLLLSSTENPADAWKKKLKVYNQEKLQRESLEVCKESLNAFMRDAFSGSFVETVRDSTLYEHAFSYKGRLLDKSPMLHIAIWLEATDPHYSGCVQMLVEQGANLEGGKATYYSGQFLVELHPLVIAAGMGTVHVLEALTASLDESEIQDTLNRKDLCLSGGQYFYTPLHDACFLGRTSAAIWLLEHGALPMAQDRINMTPLHLFVVAGNYDDTRAVENVVKEFVKRGADLGMQVQMTGAFKARWGDYKFNPLEMATRHDANFPRDSMRFLAPSFECFQTLSGESLVAEVVEARGRTSFLADLIMLASKSPHAAEELSLNIVRLSQDAKTRRGIILQLNQDVQEPNAVEQLVRLLISSPPSAANVLRAVTQHPFVPDPTHHPIRARTNLWGPFVNLPMRCTYKPDARVSNDGTLQPTWFNQVITQWFPSWHDTFAPHVDDIRHRSSAYDISVYTLPVPDLLTLDVIQALSAIDADSYGAIFAAKPIQGIVTCMWQTLGERVHYTQMFLSVLDLFALMAWGLTVGNGSAFSRLWMWSGKSESDESLDSPTHSPFCTAWLMGTCIKEAVGLLFWLCTFVSKRRFCRCPCRRRSEDAALRGGWDLSWFFLYSGFSMQVGMLALLITLLLRVTAHDHPYMDFNTQGLLALNVFGRFWLLLTQITKNQAIGPRIISILGSLMSGTMQEMIVVGILIFTAFSCVFLVLRREHSPSWVALYLYRGLIFGDGDGLDRFGVANENDALESEGDPEQHDWSVFYGVVSTLVFGVAILNLIIAIYSDEYKAQQQKAPMFFVQKRALSCTESMIKYHSLGGWLRMSVQLRWFSFVLLFSCTSALIFLDNVPDFRPAIGLTPMLFFAASLVGIAQLALMVAQAHTAAIPCEKPVQDRAIPRRCFSRSRAWMQSYGEHHVVSEQRKVADLAKRGRRWLKVQEAKLLSTHCLQVKVEAAFPKGPLLDQEWFEDACRKALLTWHTELRSDFLTPSDVLDVMKSDKDAHVHFVATLVFEPLLDIWRPFKLRLGDRGNCVSAEVRLPHFMWMCCRVDFDDVQSLKQGETSQLDKIQKDIKRLDGRPANQDAAEKTEVPKLARVPSQQPSPVGPLLGNRAILRRTMSQSLGAQPDIVGRTVSAASQQPLSRTLSPVAPAAVARAEGQHDSASLMFLKEVKELCSDVKDEVVLKHEEQNSQMEGFKEEVRENIAALNKAVSSITAAVETLTKGSSKDQAVPEKSGETTAAATEAAAAGAASAAIAEVVRGLAVSASSIDQEVDVVEEEEQGEASSTKKRRNRKKKGANPGADEATG